MRGTFQRTASDILRDDEKVVVLLGDIGVWAFRDTMADYPLRVLNFGIMEQTMISFAAGLSAMNLIPIVHSIAPFLIERPFEQIKIDFGYQSLPGNLVSVGGSFDYGALGSTHHAPGDVATLLNIPGIQILVPGHSDELAWMMRQYYKNEYLTYYRLSEIENLKPYCLEKGSCAQLRSGNKATVLSIGPNLGVVLDASEGLDLNILYINEISRDSIEEALAQVKGTILIVVEPFYEGTLAQLFVPYLGQIDFKLAFEGVPREFFHSYGTYDDLNKVARLDKGGLRNRILSLIT